MPGAHRVPTPPRATSTVSIVARRGPVTGLTQSETVNVVSIAAVWNPQRRKDVVPEIIDIAEAIGANQVALPVQPIAARRIAAKARA